MKTREERRREKRMDLWAVLAWIVVAVILLLVLTGEALSPVPEPPTARELAARFAAQEEYYRVADLYGDLVGATEAAKIMYQEVRHD